LKKRNRVAALTFGDGLSVFGRRNAEVILESPGESLWSEKPAASAISPRAGLLRDLFAGELHRTGVYTPQCATFFSLESSEPDELDDTRFVSKLA